MPTYDKSTGRLTRLDYDANGNGKRDTWTFMDGARLIRLEADENEDGKADKWETYTDQGLAVLALATQGRGKPDRRLVYRPDGSLDRIEVDPSGSYQFQPVAK